LGHLAAFRYHRPTRILLLQTNIQSASPNRVSVYVQKLTNGAGTYVFKPVLREDALERFKNRTLRSFTVGFASPENLEALDEKGLASAKGARLLAEAFNGLEFTITVSAGRGKKKYLNFDTVWNEVTSLLGSGADIKKLEVMANPDDEGNDIDFLEEHLKCRAELELSDGDPEANYQVRRSFLASEFAVRLPYVMKHFGAPQ
jgi:hypothetical protein